MNVRYSKYLPGFVYLHDVALLNVAAFIANEATQQPRFLYHHDLTALLLQLNMLWLVVSTFSKSYLLPRPLQPTVHINKLLRTLACHLLGVLGTIYFFRLYQVPRSELLIFYLLFFIFMFTGRSFLFYLLDFIRKRGYNHRQVLIVGDSSIYSRIARLFSSHPEYGYDIVGYINHDDLNTLPKDELQARLFAKNPHEIFVCYKETNKKLLNYLLDLAKAGSVRIKLVSDLVLMDGFVQLVNYENMPVLTVASKPGVSMKILVLKRAFDIAFSITIMILGLPVFLTLYIITRLTSKGPVFYQQERIGKDEKPFKMYKFRTMHVDAEQAGPQLSHAADPRITKWGRIMRRTRLDELPQFWNVLKGDMSVVGPRPERKYFIEKIVERKPTYKKLLRVKPGITSIGQVQYGYAENIDQMCDRMVHDLQYLQNISLNHDLNIIMRTIKVMVQQKGK